MDEIKISEENSLVFVCHLRYMCRVMYEVLLRLYVTRRH